MQRLIFRQMQSAAKQARGDDTHLLKICLPDILAVAHKDKAEPPLDKYNKLERGFKNNLTGSLLCPAGYNWEDPKYVVLPYRLHLMLMARHRTQQALKTFKIKMGKNKWPLVLYEKNTFEFDPNKPLKGLCRSVQYILVSDFSIVCTSHR